MELVAELTNPQNLRIRLPVGTKERWASLLERKRISQQDAIVALVELVLSQQDDVIQSMLLGQTVPRPEMMELVLRGLASGKGKGLRGTIVEKDGRVRNSS